MLFSGNLISLLYKEIVLLSAWVRPIYILLQLEHSIIQTTFF